MRRELITCAICAGCLGTVACDQDSQNDAMDALLKSPVLDPSIELEIDCLPPPPEARSVLFAGTFVNEPPIRPDSEEFPEDFCPPNARFYALAEGSGNSSVLGDFIWSERYRALPMAKIVAEGSFSGANGDRLDWDAQM